jgi:N6-L-threonylcarbamoyladenine synthase
MIVLGIETSCDETAVALCGESGLLAHIVYSQIDKHQPYGGVVPEIAARDHVSKLIPLLTQTLEQANISSDQLSAVAYTSGPGLAGALMVGAAVGRSLAYGLGIPAISIHHIEAHLMAVMLEDDKPQYPFLALIVSGGHTLLVNVKSFGDYEILGQSIDDAVGEAFDKTAKLLGLPYPGGPALAQLAVSGNSERFNFPRPMSRHSGFNFSFSGLKTAAVKVSSQLNQPLAFQDKADIASSFQEAAIESLLIKVKQALKETGLKQIAMVGGVSANVLLRKRCAELAHTLGVRVYYPRPEWCTDNGAMVAYTGYLRFSQNESTGLPIRVKARWPIDSL